MKFDNGFRIVNLEKQIGSVRMRAPFVKGNIKASEELSDVVLRLSHLWRQNTEINKSDNFNFDNITDVLPKDDQYISVNFRALSKTIVPGHWIDWSKDDVLKDSVQMLLGATVYPNHEFSDINNWLGSVSNVGWDEEGANSEGVPGINATYKIDALMNPRIARGLLMSPPAIHSTSMTVLFKFEPSHPEIFNDNRWRFYELLGEEIEGSIVRFIVTEILEYWEASLVFQGADRLAKQYNDDDTEDFENLSADKSKTDSLSKPAPKTTNDKEKTMKLTKEEKAKLGIEFEGEDVPESEILKAAQTLAAQNAPFKDVNLSELQAKATVADSYVEEKRAEVRRLARLAELGADEGELDEVISEDIDNASFERLGKLQNLYQKKAAEKFPNGRSSKESFAEVETAGGVTDVQQATVQQIGLH